LKVSGIELGKMSAVGQHNALRTWDAGLDGAGVRVDIEDVVFSDDDQRRHGDLVQARQRRAAAPVAKLPWASGCARWR
jgi:hypothetical protein